MTKYHKIQTVLKRDQKSHRVIDGEYSTPEFEFLKNAPWVLTEKVDGTNIRIMWDGNEIRFGGKTDKAQLYAPLFERLQELFGKRVEDFRRMFGDNDDNFNPEHPGVCLYGEGYGNGIQKDGKLYLPDSCDFILFDVRVGEWWLQRENVVDIAEKLGLDVVPIVDTCSLVDMIAMVRTGFKSKWGNFNAEGVVARPALELKTRKGERLITKLKHKDFK